MKKKQNGQHKLHLSIISLFNIPRQSCAKYAVTLFNTIQSIGSPIFALNTNLLVVGKAMTDSFHLQATVLPLKYFIDLYKAL